MVQSACYAAIVISGSEVTCDLLGLGLSKGRHMWPCAGLFIVSLFLFFSFIAKWGL